MFSNISLFQERVNFVVRKASMVTEYLNTVNYFPLTTMYTLLHELKSMMAFTHNNTGSKTVIFLRFCLNVTTNTQMSGRLDQNDRKKQSKRI